MNVQLQTVHSELQVSRGIFTKKTTEQSRHLAWVSAAIISTVSCTVSPSPLFCTLYIQSVSVCLLDDTVYEFEVIFLSLAIWQNRCLFSNSVTNFVLTFLVWTSLYFAICQFSSSLTKTCKIFVLYYYVFCCEISVKHYECDQEFMGSMSSRPVN